ncbi:MAG: class I SAM-dependent methyltransferase [Candidatus Edwardsbacteria bacterium]|nr:class I SAM-dependent methyltransferase [Candidatus Edwardsbacteria bacterium]
MQEAARCAPPPRRILDAGCGPGLYLAELARVFPGADLAGIDLQQEKLDQADAVLSALGVPHALLRADLTTARLGNGHDLIICSDVLEHIADDGAAIMSLAAALGDGGRLLITVPAASRFSSSVAADFDHKRDGYTPEALRQLLDAAGLDVVRHRQYFKGPGRLAWRANRMLLRWPALAVASFPPLFALAWLDRLLPDDREAGGLMVTAMKKSRNGPRAH